MAVFLFVVKFSRVGCLQAESFGQLLSRTDTNRLSGGAVTEVRSEKTPVHEEHFFLERRRPTPDICQFEHIDFLFEHQHFFHI